MILFQFGEMTIGELREFADDENFSLGEMLGVRVVSHRFSECRRAYMVMLR